MVGEEAAFGQQVDAFVRDRYALDPTAATIAGLHDHDAKLADLSLDGFAARDAFTDRWLNVFESHDARSWAASTRTDLALVLGELRGEKALRPFERQVRQPSLYSDAIIRGAYYALIRDEGDTETRLGALAAAARRRDGLRGISGFELADGEIRTPYRRSSGCCNCYGARRSLEPGHLLVSSWHWQS